jgi:molecular chaperone DnaK
MQELRTALDNADITHDEVQDKIKPLQQALFEVTQAVERYSQVERVKNKDE